MGDWSKVCTLRSYGPTRIDIKVVVEITKKTHTLEKLTVFHSGTLPPGSKLEQLGDGTNLGYNAANNTYDFGVRFQVTNFDGSLNSKAELLLGTVNLNNNSYVLRIAK